MADTLFFREADGCYVIEHKPEHLGKLKTLFSSSRLTFEPCGKVIDRPMLRISNYKETVGELAVDAMTRAWRGTLDW